MQSDPYYDALSKVFPILLLGVLGIYWISTMVGVPLGIILLSVAIGLAVYRIHGKFDSL